MTIQLDEVRANLFAALDKLRMANREPVIDSPTNAFEEHIIEHAELQALIEDVKAALKPVESAERKYRDGIAASLDTFFAADLKEGVNNYELSNGRKVKYTRKVERTIDSGALPMARELYSNADDVPAGVTFDSLLRVKYELEKRPYNKLATGGAAWTAFSHAITAKTAAPVVKVD